MEGKSKTKRVQITYEVKVTVPHKEGERISKHVYEDIAKKYVPEFFIMREEDKDFVVTLDKLLLVKTL